MSDGNKLNLSLDVPSGCDFDIWVSTSTSLQENQLDRHVPIDSEVARSVSGGTGADESLEYTAASSREYYVAIHSHSGTGSYTLESNETLEEYTPPIIPSYSLIILTWILASGIIIGIIQVTKKRRVL